MFLSRKPFLLSGRYQFSIANQGRGSVVAAHRERQSEDVHRERPGLLMKKVIQMDLRPLNNEAPAEMGIRFARLLQEGDATRSRLLNFVQEFTAKAATRQAH
jgi:hypothetical protein